jgi:hypothetical protein
MLRKSVGFGVLALAGAALVPSSTVEAGGFRGGGPSYGIHFSGPAGILLQRRSGPRMHPPRLGSPHHIGRAAWIGRRPGGGIRHRGLARPPFQHIWQHAWLESPNFHIPRGHHRILFGGLSYPITIGEDWGYIGTSYDPAETVPVYVPPAILDVSDPPAPQAMPRVSSAREGGEDACRSERVTVPAREGDREITIVRC